MIKNIFLIAIMLSCSITWASSLSSYRALVNEAELLICNDKFQSALQHYDKAFTLSGMQPRGKDVYHAWICAYRVDDPKLFILYSTWLAKKGAFLHDGVPENILNQLEGGPSVSRYTTIWKQIKTSVKSELDEVYEAEMDSLLLMDQELRSYFQSRCGETQYNICGRDSLNIFDSINVQRFKELILRKGFPTETRIGFFNRFPSNSPVYYLTLLHDRSWTNRQTLDSILYTQVMAGELDPQIYATLKGESYSSFNDTSASYQDNPYSWYATNQFMQVDGKLYIAKLSYYDTAKINIARRSIYVESMQDMCVKAGFQFNHKYFHFLLIDFFTMFSDLPDDVAARIKNVMSYQQGETDAFNTICQHRCKYGLRH